LERQALPGTRRNERTLVQWERMHPAHAAGDDFALISAPFVEAFGSLHPSVPHTVPPFRVTFA
jgi:hypothetical protein